MKKETATLRSKSVNALRAAVLISVLALTGCATAPDASRTESSANVTAEPKKATAELTETEIEEVPKAAPVAEDINGHWCPTAESDDSYGCVTIALPTATYDSGDTRQLSSIGEQNGGFAFIVPGAPFGTYYPAGVAIEIPEYYSGADLPDQDRIWNGQTGSMLVRQ